MMDDEEAEEFLTEEDNLGSFHTAGNLKASRPGGTSANGHNLASAFLRRQQ